jgi:protein-disulfide isomerase
MKKIISLVLMLVLFAGVASAEDASFESLILDVIKKNPQVIKETLEKYEKQAAEKSKEDEFTKLLSDRVEVNIGDSPFKGKKNAEITIVGFSDFQCPFCKRGDDTIKEIQKKYGDKVRYVFKHFPLAFHPNAEPASRACWAAGKQGKMYEFHDKLFENQPKLGEELYVQIAKDLKLNVDKFNKDRNSEEATKAIKSDMEDGQKIGIQGTPGFIVNGVKVLGAYPVDYFEKVISALEAAKK